METEFGKLMQSVMGWFYNASRIFGLKLTNTIFDKNVEAEFDQNFKNLLRTYLGLRVSCERFRSLNLKKKKKKRKKEEEEEEACGM